MKEVFRSNLGKKAVKATIWGAVGLAIAAAGNGLLILAMKFFIGDNIDGAIKCHNILNHL